MRWPRPFRRSGSNGEPPARPTDDWNAGDQAECIYHGPWFMGGIRPAPAGWGPQFGEVRLVSGTKMDTPAPGIVPENLYLRFDRYGDRAFLAEAFRKVTPRADEAQVADAAFIGTMERIRQPQRISARAVILQLVLPPLAGTIFLYSAALTLWAVAGSGQVLV